jgi:hypothetical protein
MMFDEMRVLTVRQPWAWAIIHGGKDVENRVRNVAGNYRGPVAIHAGLTHADSIDTEARLVAEAVGRLARAKQATGMGMVPSRVSDPNDRSHWVHERFGNRGAIIGVVELTDVHDATTRGQLPRCWGPGERIGDRGEGDCSPWALPAEKHLVLANPRPLAAPIPYKGALGLRRLDKETIDTITAALAAETGEDH